MESLVYNEQGKETGKVALPEAVFGLPKNDDLVHQVVVSMQSNARTNVAHVKDRSEVRGGGKKPWKQKGTGRARHGSRRSPIWIGGGVTHGPRNEKNFDKKINRKMARKALHTVLSGKVKDAEVLFVDSFSTEEPKAAWAKGVLDALGGVKGYEAIANRKNNAVLIAVGEKNDAVFKSFGNFGNVAIMEARNINPVDALSYKHIVFVGPDACVAEVAREKGNA
ncbi:MAG: 50S ribosomal protein L4 [Parcubacteria group bacterium]|nr:50S ribosomal protein L4 [Parcubacteria group bacterium]